MNTLTDRARRAAIAATALAAFSLLAAACGSSGTETAKTAKATGNETSTIDVTTRDYGFDMDTTKAVRSGLVTVRLHNAGSEDHQVQLVRLHDGVKMDDLNAALRSGDEKKAFGLFDFTGGSNAVVTGGSQESLTTLRAGDYAMLCFVPSADGTPHLAKGMVMPFKVVAASGGTSAPAVAGEVTLGEFRFGLPAGFGKGTYKVTNGGAQPHELTIVRLSPGRTPADAAAFFQSGGHGPPPFTSAGGVGVIAPGASEYGQLDLTPGDYLALCYVPDAGTGMPHAAMGMVAAFTVR
jgi:plastocyanin